MRTYWWRSQSYPNLGDELTRLVLERRFDVEPTHSPLIEADLAATGSLLGWLWEGSEADRNRRPLQVVGSGFMTADVTVSKLPNVTIHSVRGYLSKNKLGALDSNRITIGDPGLLAALIAKPSKTAPKRGSKYGIILHHKHSENEQVKNRFAHLDATFLNIRTTDLDSFIEQMQQCEIIVSQSLHGLIIADALGKPNTWLELGPIHAGGNFKFLDYFSSVGRPAYRKLGTVPQDANDIDRQTFESDPVRIDTLTKFIDRAFSEAIRKAGLLT